MRGVLGSHKEQDSGPLGKPHFLYWLGLCHSLRTWCRPVSDQCDQKHREMRRPRTNGAGDPDDVTTADDQSIGPETCGQISMNTHVIIL